MHRHWLVAALAFSTLGTSAALAQGVPTPQPGPLHDADKRTPAEIQAEDYSARGVHLGGFMLFPSLELDELFDDNIYASSSSVGKTSSFVQVVKPSVELHSNWDRNMLNLYARGAFGIYSADASQNYQDVSVGADGRLDILRTSKLYGGASFNHLHEALGTPNSPVGAFQINQYNQLSGSLGYYQEFGRFRGRVESQVDHYDYTNNGLGPAQGVVPNSDRNRTELRESLRVGYEFLEGYELWTRGSLNQRLYDKSPDSLGFFRNSSGWDWVGGVSVALSSITSIEAFAGYVEQDYVDSRFSAIRTPTFGLTGYWSPIREVLIKPYVKRTIDDTSLTTASAYLNTSFGVDATYDYRPNIKLEGHGDYSIADYETVAGSAGRDDQYLTFRAGIMYLPTQNFFVGPQYQYTHRYSSLAGLDYGDNQIMLRLGARL
jgi:hypothetical protein